MFHGRRLNNKINHLHERSLLMVYKGNNSHFKNQFKAVNSFTVYSFHSIAIELFKVTENLSNTIMNHILQTRTLAYSLRSQTDFARSFVNTSRFGLNSLRYFALKMRNIITPDIKNASNLHTFKNKIRK